MKVLVTGGNGFLGGALCRHLLAAGHELRVLDNHWRGRADRSAELSIEVFVGDVRDPDLVRRATEGCEVVWHLAFVNGTRHFYEVPDLVLEVGVKGAVNTIESAIACGVRRYVLASTGETYHEPTRIPTDESVRLVVPDVKNPRYSYGGGKIVSELLATHMGGRRGLEVVIFRPHNFYGPDMGFEHFMPEIIERIIELSDGLKVKRIELPIQGTGEETRAFCYIDDGAYGAFLAGEKGGAGEIYHVGTPEEVSVRSVVEKIGKLLGVELDIVLGPLREGGPPRRCPAIAKLAALGYQPKVFLEEGLERTVRWYAEYFLSRRTS